MTDVVSKSVQVIEMRVTHLEFGIVGTPGRYTMLLDGSSPIVARTDGGDPGDEDDGDRRGG